LVWGFTREIILATDIFKTQFSIGYNLESSHTNETTFNISILRTRKPRQRPGDEATTENYVDLLSYPALIKLLNTMMPDTKTKVIQVPFSKTGRVYLNEEFNDL